MELETWMRRRENEEMKLSFLFSAVFTLFVKQPCCRLGKLDFIIVSNVLLFLIAIVPPGGICTRNRGNDANGSGRFA
jgi:hypothetical protein